MTLRSRIFATSDPIAGSRELARRLAVTTDHQLTVVWADRATCAYLIGRYRPLGFVESSPDVYWPADA